MSPVSRKKFAPVGPRGWILASITIVDCFSICLSPVLQLVLAHLYPLLFWGLPAAILVFEILACLLFWRRWQNRVVLLGTMLLAHFTETVLCSPYSPFYVRAILITAICLSIALFGVLLMIASYTIFVLTHRERQHPFTPINPFALNLPAEEVTFPSNEGQYLVNGWYIPHLGATTTLLICLGYRRLLKDVLEICKHLWKHGHTILIIGHDRQHLPSGATVTLGFCEINDFLGAVAYAKKRTPSTRIGALGYSMGATMSIMGSERACEVEAIVADSAVASNWSAIEFAIHRSLHLPEKLPPLLLNMLYILTDILICSRSGYHLQLIEPLRAIRGIAPRPILIIHGMDDTVVDPEDAQLLYNAARSPKTLWLLPKTGHTQAYCTDSSTYLAKISAFFDLHLKHVPYKREQLLASAQTLHDAVRRDEPT